MPQKMYSIIKKLKGEAFAKAIRDYDARIFDVPNIQEWVRYARRDVEPLLPFLRSLISKGKTKETSNASPFELLKKAGYTAFYADTLKKQNSIKKYFSKKEELCTFSDPNRFKRYHIIHCVKEGAEKLNRRDFKNPEREDEYGTSVISIQILKSGGFIKICNRYNHTVDNPDNTFDSNPDNIILGLSDSLKKHFNVDFTTPCLSKYVLPNHYIIVQNQLIYYTLEKEDMYFGDGVYVDGGEIIPIQKDYQFFMNQYLFDLKAKTVTTFFYDDDKFANVLIEEMKGKNIQRKKNKNGFDLLLDGELFLSFDEDKNVTKARLLKAVSLPDNSFKGERALTFFEAPNLNMIGNYCFEDTALNHFFAPNLIRMGVHCFSFGCDIEKFVFENLKSMGAGCFFHVKAKELYFPKLKEIPTDCLRHNKELEKIYAPKVLRIGEYGIYSNEKLKEVFLPSCKKVGSKSLSYNFNLKVLNLLKLKQAEEGAVSFNLKLKKIYVPKLATVERYAFSDNDKGCYIEAPNLVFVGFGAFKNAGHLYAPYLRANQIVFATTRYMIQKRQFIKENERLMNMLTFGLLNFLRGKQRGR
ncbi:MAG: leucine-rich repeat protein [Alphaproteobacteria bacterium]|nr:leucine-rich repeat protein [Alphaproteobacteria bacterium]